MQETACKQVTGSGGIGTTRRYSTYMMTLAALLHIRSVLTHFDHRDIALFGYHLHRFLGIQMRIGKRLVLVGEDDVHILLDQSFQERVVLVHHVI